MVARNLMLLKLLRDLWSFRAQNLAIGMTIALGVAFYGAATMSYQNLDASYRYSYDRLAFEDFGIRVRQAPDRVTRRLHQIPGVSAVEGRASEDMAMELPNRTNRRVLAHLISVPADRRPRVDDLQIASGRYLRPGGDREALIEANFAKYHGLVPGDPLEIVQGSARLRFRIVGIVRSPEFLYVVRSKQDLFPMPDVYGVVFATHRVLGSTLGRPGTIDEVKFKLEDPAKLTAAMREAKRMLQPYGPEDPVPRSEIPSHQLLQQDIKGFKSYSVLFPALFLTVAGITFYTLMQRSVARQRGIIGLLRAVGFSRGAVVRHYLAGGVVVGIFGSAVGTVAGWLFAGWATRAYLSYGLLSIPYIRYVPAWNAIATGMALGVSVCVLACLGPARAAASIGPAEALRGADQSTGKTIRLDRLVPRIKLLWRIPFRNLFRQPRRSLATMMGIVSGLALVIVAQGLMDSGRAMIDELIRSMFQDDLRVGFVLPRDGATVERIHAWPGVIWAEGQLDVPLDFKRNGTTYSALLAGVPEGTRFRTLKDEAGRPIELPRHGAIFGPTLKKKLGLQVGDFVSLHLPKGASRFESNPKVVRAAGFCEEPVGTVAYLRDDELWRLFHRELEWPPGAATSVAVKTDPAQSQEVERRLLALGGVGAVTSIRDMRATVMSLIQMSEGFVFVMLIFGAGLAFAIVFSMVSINVGERSAEIATLRTLGVSRAELVGLIGLENAILTLVGIVIGLPVAKSLTQGFLIAAQSEEQMDLFKMSVSVRPQTYILAASVILAIVVFAQIPSFIAATRLNLAQAAKERAS